MNRVGRIVFAVLAAVAAATAAYRAREGVETDLLGLVDSAQAGMLKEVAAGSSRQGRVLIEGPVGAELAPYVEKTLAALDQPPAGSFKETLVAISDRGAGLLSARTRELLLAGKHAEVEKEALARLYGPVPPLFGVKRDPFLFATDYVMSLEADLAPGWTLKEGYPTRELAERVYVLLTVDLGGVVPLRIADFLHEAEGMSAPVRIWCGGPAFHAAVTSERAKKEINGLSVLSLAAVLGIGFWLLRSFGFVPRLMCALGVSGLLATGALFGCFPRPHVLTFVFGTSLIGLAVDYVYHACAAGEVRKVRRPLTLAMSTTVAAFVPLMFSGVGVLRQMALFTAVGLTAAWGWVLFADWGTKGNAQRPPEGTTPRLGWGWRMVLAGAVLAASAWGVTRLRLVSDPAAFYRPTAYLAESERKLSRVCPENAGRFVYVKGCTLQEALENEEAAGVKGLSSVIPSLKRQRENLELVRKFREAVGKDYAAKTGIKAAVSAKTDEAAALLDPEQVTDSRLKGIVKAMWTQGGLISPCPEGFVVDSPQTAVLAPRQALEEMFAGFTVATCRLLWLSLGALVILLAAFFRRRFLVHALPLAAALVATAGTLGMMGVRITFFTLLCFFVLVGLGVDYVIFHQGSDTAGTRRTVFGSFLTSLIGLGALAFTGFAVTAAMGVTFAVGLFHAWFFAWAFSGGGASARSGTEALAWHEQREQSAGAWRIGFMWWVYRLLGKGVLKAVCVPVMAFVYPFAGPARRALAEFREVLAEHARGKGRRVKVPSGFMHLLGFAWSLVDKTDVCTLRRSPPKVEVREDEGFRAFAKSVATGRGAFLVSSHLGTVEVLPAMAGSAAVKGLPRPRLHAFQQLGHDAEFTRMFLRNFGDAGFELHAVESIGVETAVEMRAAVERGELVLMAGDRTSAGSGKTLENGFLGRNCAWPKGVFAFALLLECPICFVTCVHTGYNRYEVHFAEWKESSDTTEAAGGKRRRLVELLGAYVKFLEEETLAYPSQWYQFYPFFRSKGLRVAFHG